MVTKKVKKIIRKKLYEYPIYDRLINELELEKANSIKSNAKQGSMAAKANKVKEFNERNSR